MSDAVFDAHLARAMTNEDWTVILVTVDGKAGLVSQTRCFRTADLIAAARCLLEQARDRLDDEGADDPEDYALRIAVEDSLLLLRPEEGEDE